MTPSLVMEASTLLFTSSFDFPIGKRIWTLNNILLSNLDYLNVTKKAIIDEKLKYGLSVYTTEFIESWSSDQYLELLNDDDIFLELLYKGWVYKVYIQTKKEHRQKRKTAEKRYWTSRNGSTLKPSNTKRTLNAKI